MPPKTICLTCNYLNLCDRSLTSVCGVRRGCSTANQLASLSPCFTVLLLHDDQERGSTDSTRNPKAGPSRKARSGLRGFGGRRPPLHLIYMVRVARTDGLRNPLRFLSRTPVRIPALKPLKLQPVKTSHRVSLNQMHYGLASASICSISSFVSIYSR